MRKMVLGLVEWLRALGGPESGVQQLRRVSDVALRGFVGWDARARAFVNSPVAFRAFSCVLVTAAAVGLFEVALSATADGPWETAVEEMCDAFTGILGQGLSLIAIVIGGLLYAFGEGGSKSQIAGLVFGAGLVLQAPGFLEWTGLMTAVDCDGSGTP